MRIPSMKCQVLQAFTKPKPQFSRQLASVRSLRRAVRRFQFETQQCGFAHDPVGRGSGTAIGRDVGHPPVVTGTAAPGSAGRADQDFVDAVRKLFPQS
jgi:hypothetical protein